MPLDQSVSGGDFDFEKKKEKISEFCLLEIREEKGFESFPPVLPLDQPCQCRVVTSSFDRR